jgi:hypothetical protein
MCDLKLIYLSCIALYYEFQPMIENNGEMHIYHFSRTQSQSTQDLECDIGLQVHHEVLVITFLLLTICTEIQ